VAEVVEQPVAMVGGERVGLDLARPPQRSERVVGDDAIYRPSGAIERAERSVDHITSRL